MDIQPLINTQLHEIHKSRSRIGITLSIFFILTSTFFQREQILNDSLWIIVLVVAGMGLTIRALMSSVFHKKWSDGLVFYKGLNYLGFILFGLGWGLHFLDVYLHYGAQSPNVSYALLIVMGFIASASSTLSADKGSYYTFITTVVLFCLGVYATHFTGDVAIIVFILLYYAFCFSNYMMIHRQLRSLVEAQIKSQIESNRLHNVINSVPAFVSLYDREQRCYMANQAFMDAIPHVLGSRLGSITNGSAWEKIAQDFLAGDLSYDVQEYHSLVSGAERWFLLNMQKTADGGLVIVGVDSTAIVVANKALREQEGKTQYASKLASLGEMAAGIAHEVNNPMTIIQGSAHIIRKLAEDPSPDMESIRSLSQKLVDTCDRISKIIKSLKSLSRNAQNDPMEQVSISKLIDQTLDICGQRFKREEIKLTLPDAIDEEVMGREVQLAQVMLNLLNNAIDAVKVLKVKWVEVRLRTSDEWTDILVTDSGTGIPLEVQQKMMEPFFTTKEVHQGTGLGLSISKSIMHEHGGELLFLTEQDHTTFCMRLPRMKE